MQKTKLGVWIRSFAVCGLVLLGVWRLASGVGSRAQTKDLAEESEIHGYVSSTFAEGQTVIRIPGVNVYLETDSKDVVAETVTDHLGFYLLRPTKTGRYRLCMKAPGFASRCEADFLSLSSGILFLKEDNVIVPNAEVLQGRVLLASGEPCFHAKTAFGRLETAKVALVDGKGRSVSGPVDANVSGEYVLPSIPASGMHRLRVNCFGRETFQDAVLENSELSVIPRDITIPNSAPKITSVFVYDSAKHAVRFASPGTDVSVRIQAEDPDGDELHFTWLDAPPPHCFMGRC